MEFTCARQEQLLQAFSCRRELGRLDHGHAQQVLPIADRLVDESMDWHLIIFAEGSDSPRSGVDAE